MFLKIAFAVLPGPFKQVGRVHGAIPVPKIVGVQPSSLYHLVKLVTVCQNHGEFCSTYAGYS